MQTRRNFLQVTATGLAAMAFHKSTFAAGTERPIGVQLYTVRDQAEKDLPAVLKQIQAIGYKEVELYWNVYTRPASELKRMISDHGLTAPSGHLNYEGLPSKLDYAKELGFDWVVCPMLPKTMWNSLDSFKQAADQFNKWGEQVQALGMKFAFHNHNYEFKKFGNTTGYDTLVASTDPKLVSFEMDCYWVTQAGRDPVQMMEKLGNRVRMLHLKDRKPGFPASQQMDEAAEHFTEVGNGSIAWAKVLQEAKKVGVEHYYVEQDKCDKPPMDSLAISYKYLKPLFAKTFA
jgi:sugar phosphate isomerase/epimerase